ncbi:MAG: glycoside hydrolase 5 family protein [Phototrophicaceae bacterium]|jgi:endo-1,4-beta-mannosidase
MTTPFVLGVNYWPRRKAMNWWKQFDADEVREEFDIIASVGMNVVRIFLLWDDWMPTPTTVDAACLDNLGTVLDIAAERNLGLDITFFTGHMSGPNWAPGWMLSDEVPFPVPALSSHQRQVISGGQEVHTNYRNFFNDPLVIDAAKLLLHTVVDRYEDHAGVWMWNLGNEPDLFAWPADHAQGQAWVREMTALIKALDPIHPVTCGLHMDSVVQNNGLRPNEVFAETDVAVIHGYPMYAGWSRQPLDPDFVPYACALVSAFCGKPTLAEEWGGCTTDQAQSEVWEWEGYNRTHKQFMASEADFADYVGKVLPNLLEVGSTGALLWCFADYVPELWDSPPCDYQRHERFFGLVRPDGSLKPHADVIRAFAATNPTVQPATRTVTLDVTPDAYFDAPLEHSSRLYRDYIARYEGE